MASRYFFSSLAVAASTLRACRARELFSCLRISLSPAIPSVECSKFRLVRLHASQLSLLALIHILSTSVYLSRNTKHSGTVSDYVQNSLVVKLEDDPRFELSFLPLRTFGNRVAHEYHVVKNALPLSAVECLLILRTENHGATRTQSCWRSKGRSGANGRSEMRRRESTVV